MSTGNERNYHELGLLIDNVIHLSRQVALVEFRCQHGTSQEAHSLLASAIAELNGAARTLRQARNLEMPIAATKAESTHNAHIGAVRERTKA